MTWIKTSASGRPLHLERSSTPGSNQSGSSLAEASGEARKVDGCVVDGCVKEQCVIAPAAWMPGVKAQMLRPRAPYLWY